MEWNEMKQKPKKKKEKKIVSKKPFQLKHKN